MKRILGLDLGTNSIGWALIEIDYEKGFVKILGLGSRILPMDAGEISEYERGGKIKSTAAQRTEKRGLRRLNERYLLRRDRLHLVLNLLGTLPNHYKLEIDFINKKNEKCGQFKKNAEPKLAYLPKQAGQKAEFLFMDSYREMLKDIGNENVKNKKGHRIPYDWTLYYLRQKALSQEISLEEFAWVLLSYNQKRGYEKTEVVDKATEENVVIDELDLRVKDVIQKFDKEGKQYFEVHLDGNDSFIYNEYSEKQMTFKDDLKEIIKKSMVDEQGNTDHKKMEITVVDIYSLKIRDVHYENEEGKYTYTITYQNGWKEIKQTKKFTNRYKNALNKPYDYIVETVYDKQGKVKSQKGKERKLREPDLSESSSDWTLLKKKTEKEALVFNSEKEYKNSDGSAKKYISPKIYSVLKKDAKAHDRTKIIGGMFQVVDRDFYREELKQIIATQRKFHKSLRDLETFEQCVKTLYPKNKKHHDTLLKNKDTIQHLLVEDILLYQRPLKSKKSEIADCKYEVRYWKDVVDKNGNPIEEIDLETGEIKVIKEPVYIKAVSTSHPYFQEFRIWDKLHNLRLIQLEREVDGKLVTNQDITKDYFKSETEYQELFDELNNRRSLSQDQFLAYCKRKFKIDYKPKDSNFVWNFPEDEELKGNETRVSFATYFKRCGFAEYADFLTQEKETELWHYLYSVSYKERTKNDNKSIKTFFNNYFKDLDIDEKVKEKIIRDFANYPKFTSRYCAYSEKALKKLLPLIQLGNRVQKFSWTNEKWYQKWQEGLVTREIGILERLKEIDFNADKVDLTKVIFTNANLQAGELPFPKGLFNTFKDFEKLEDFVRLNLAQASYLVYGRHSELMQAKYWTTPDDIRKQLHQELKQHSLNNPVAERVLLEMMQVVADIWDYYGEKGESTGIPKKLFDRIHLEVGRELKKSAAEKERESKRMSGNRSQNKRIRQVLEEFLSNSPYNANPRNSDHFERLKILEDAALEQHQYKKRNERESIDEILKEPISKGTFEKYKLWVEQGYRSPYSGKIIKIADLFNGNKYNIDHIFPQASITNNSLSNKVVVEVELNQLKSDMTARAFIQSQNGQPHSGIPVCTEEEYLSIVKTNFSGTKRYILLSKEIPKGFTNSQLNVTRHIARKAMELLSHIVREPGEVEFRSKNVLPVTGRVTAELKRAWKLDQVWRELVAPRFIRMNELTQSNLFGQWQTAKNGQRYFDCNLDNSIREKDESYNIKRIDHRHHALDALIIALCTEDHVNYINNINAKAKLRDYGKQQQIEKYRRTLKQRIKFTYRDKEQEGSNWQYMLPGEIRKIGAENANRDSVLKMTYFYKDFDSFGQNYKKMILTALQNVIASPKSSKFPIRKTTNKYWSYKNEQGELNLSKGNLVKKLIKQIDKNNPSVKNKNQRNIAIRKGMHDEIPYGEKLYNFELKELASNLKCRTDIIDDELKVRIEDLYYICNEDLNELSKRIKLDKTFPNKTFFKLKKPVPKYTTRKSLVGLTRKQIDKIADPLIYNALQNHIKEYDSIDDALNSSGIEHFNKNRKIPVYKVTLIESGSGRYILGESGIKPKQKKMVVGKNFCFVIDKSKEEYHTISLKEIITDYINGKKVKDFVESDNHNEIYLFPGDLVYFESSKNEKHYNLQNIYQFINSSGYTANFAPVNFASVIWNYGFPDNKKEEKDFNKLLLKVYDFKMKNGKPLKNELGLGSKQNKNTKEVRFVDESNKSKNELLASKQIKENCIKLKVDRLGNISKA